MKAQALWHDSNIENNKKYILKIQKQLNIQITQTQNVKNTLKQIQHKSNICLVITSGRNGEALALSMEDMRSNIPIIVFCKEDTYHRQWAKKYLYVQEVLNDYNKLVEFITNLINPSTGNNHTSNQNIYLNNTTLKGEKDTLSNYQKNRLLGKGAYSQVFEVTSKATNKVFALKETKFSHKIKNPKDEVEILRQLNHPNIIKIENAFFEGTTFYVCMQLANGDTLDRKIVEARNQRQLFPESYIADIFYKLCDSIEFCHKNNILHRDIKPQNILFHDGEPILSDFGVSKILESEYATSYAGTTVYMAPEIQKKLPYKNSADVYSLGVTLFQTLVLATNEIVQHNLQNNDFNIDKDYYSQKMIGLVMGMMEKSPETRLTLDSIKTTLLSISKKSPNQFEEEKKVANFSPVKSMKKMIEQQSIPIFIFNPSTCILKIFQTKSEEFQEQQLSSNLKRNGMTIIQSNQKLFLLGGQHSLCFEDYKSNFMICKNFQIQPITDMNQKRFNFGAASFSNSRIYVLGGRNSMEFLSECEYYEIELDLWKELPQLWVRKCQCGVVILKSQHENFVFAIGGLDEELTYKAEIQKLSIDNDHSSWENIPLQNMSKWKGEIGIYSFPVTKKIIILGQSTPSFQFDITNPKVTTHKPYSFFDGYVDDSKNNYIPYIIHGKVYFVLPDSKLYKYTIKKGKIKKKL